MLRQWKMVYDRAYRGHEVARAPSFDAWISSFTGTAIPQERMQPWLDNTLAWLRMAPHARVLDIGCGVGLVLNTLAPDCVEYQGIDISEKAIKRLAAWVATRPDLRHVRLATLAAHELDDIAAGSVDLVVLNSIAMYFPDARYLLTVLRSAAERLAPGGRVFLGDLRALGPLPMLAAAVGVARASRD
jgi:SAM-dependent methyltransferase